MTELTENQRKILILLDKVPNISRNVYFLIGNLGKSYSKVYTDLRILEALGGVRRIKSQNGAIFYEPSKDLMKKIYHDLEIEARKEAKKKEKK